MRRRVPFHRRTLDPPRIPNASQALPAISSEPRLAALGVVRHDVAIDELPKPMVCLAVFELLATLSSLLVDC